MENITDIKILQLVKELDAAVLSGDVRRADELSDNLFRLRGGRDEDAVMPDRFPAELSMSQSTGGHPMKKRSIRKITIIAAAVALVAALSITAVATQFFGLRDMVISGGSTASPAVSAAPVPAGQDGTPSEPVSSPEPPHDLIALQGYPDSPEYQAAAEWRSFCDGYDTDHAILNQVGNSSNKYTEQYPMYLVYSKDMADKLAEITGKYGLTVHTSMTIADNADALYDTAGTGRFLDGTSGSNIQLGGYVYDDGTFHYDGMAVLPDGAVINYQLGNYIKGTFSDTYLNVGDADTYREWQYKTASGVTVSLALGDGKALIIADLPDSFVTVNVLAGTSEGFIGSDSIDDKTLEAFADTINFTLITR